MDRIAQRIADILGSALVIVPFSIWTVIHAFTVRDYVATISDLAIAIGLLILRAETVQSERTEEAVKADLQKSDETTALLREIKVELIEQGWKR